MSVLSILIPGSAVNVEPSNPSTLESGTSISYSAEETQAQSKIIIKHLNQIDLIITIEYL